MNEDEQRGKVNSSETRARKSERFTTIQEEVNDWKPEGKLCMSKEGESKS